MRKTRPILYVLLPLFYVGVVFGLIVLQFSKNDAFSQSLGDITVTGKAPQSGQSEDILDLQIRGRGLQFSFSASRPVIIETEDGVAHNARPVSWTVKDGAIQVVFQFQFQLVFEKSGQGGKVLSIKTILPDALAKATRITIPFAAEAGATLNRDPRLPIMEISRPTGRLLASLEGGQDLIGPDNTFQLSVSGGASRSVTIEPVPEGTEPINFWLAKEGKPRSDAEVETALKDYWNKAYSGWSVGRYRPDSGAWDMGDGTSKFSETVIAAYLREALARDDYASAYQKVSVGMANNPGGWGYEAMPYLGNLMETTQGKRRQLEVLASKDQIDWTGRLTLLQDARYYGPEGLSARLEKLLLTGDVPPKLNALVAFLSNLLRLKQGGGGAALDARLDEVLRQALTKTLKQGEELFLLTPEGWFDLKSSLIMGKLLLKYSDLSQTETYRSVGIQLLLSALGRQDKNGQIPEILVLDNGKVTRQEGTIQPEELYSLLGSSVLAEVPLKGWTSTSFIRTPAALVSQTIDASTAKFVLKFPTGSAEHFVIQGVPAFDHILLHGIRWRSDPQFQSYSDGWLYSAATQTLYVKIKHRQDLEELDVKFTSQDQ